MWVSTHWDWKHEKHCIIVSSLRYPRLRASPIRLKYFSPARPSLDPKIGQGLSLTSLEATLHIAQSTGEVKVRMKRKFNPSQQERLQCSRFLDPQSLQAKMAVAGVATAEGYKVSFYASDLSDIQWNLAQASQEFIMRNFPSRGG